MLGIWLEEQQLSVRDNIDKPTPGPDEALIQLLQAGICNTDLELCRGYYPYNGILGHEFVGTVIDCPTDPTWIGQRVCGDINASCGNCPRCNKDDFSEPYMPSHCTKRTVLGIVNHNGCFAEYLVLPIRNLYKIPDSIPNDIATFVEPLAAAFEIHEQISIQDTDKVLVIGDGKLGQLVAQVIHYKTNATLRVLGKHPEKLANLNELGITTTVLGGHEASLINGGYDIAIECTGNTDGFTMALSALRPRGTLLLKSTYAGKLTIDASAVVVNEITIIGSRCGPFQKAIDALAQQLDDNNTTTTSKKINVTKLIQGRYPLSDGIQAFDHARTKGTMKILLYNNNDNK